MSVMEELKVMKGWVYADEGFVGSYSLKIEGDNVVVRRVKEREEDDKFIRVVNIEPGILKIKDYETCTIDKEEIRTKLGDVRIGKVDYIGECEEEEVEIKKGDYVVFDLRTNEYEVRNTKDAKVFNSKVLLDKKDIEYMNKVRTKRIEGLAISIGRKLKAKEYDEFNILGKELGLTEDERKVYKHTLLSVGDLERDYGINRYFKGSKKTNDEVMEEMGVSHGTYYKVRKSYLEGIAKVIGKKEEV